MKKGTKVHVKLNSDDSNNLGIGKPIDQNGTIHGIYQNGVAGHYVNIGGKTIGIPDKLNAISEIEE